uniref:SWIM-type domain-containing protein n=1 Tax=Parastrongyloides trichosuri TaxID=131310 RepID=A0A0N4ZTV9_PARTI
MGRRKLKKLTNVNFKGGNKINSTVDTIDDSTIISSPNSSQKSSSVYISNEKNEDANVECSKQKNRKFLDIGTFQSFDNAIDKLSIFGKMIKTAKGKYPTEFHRYACKYCNFRAKIIKKDTLWFLTASSVTHACDQINKSPKKKRLPLLPEHLEFLKENMGSNLTPLTLHIMLTNKFPALKGVLTQQQLRSRLSRDDMKPSKVTYLDDFKKLITELSVVPEANDQMFVSYKNIKVENDGSKYTVIFTTKDAIDQLSKCHRIAYDVTYNLTNFGGLTFLLSTDVVDPKSMAMYPRPLLVALLSRETAEQISEVLSYTKSINCNISAFMSDGAPSFDSSLKTVYKTGDTERLMCFYHVQKNTLRKTSPDDKNIVRYYLNVLKKCESIDQLKKIANLPGNNLRSDIHKYIIDEWVNKRCNWILGLTGRCQTNNSTEGLNHSLKMIANRQKKSISGLITVYKQFLEHYNVRKLPNISSKSLERLKHLAGQLIVNSDRNSILFNASRNIFFFSQKFTSEKIFKSSWKKFKTSNYKNFDDFANFLKDFCYVKVSSNKDISCSCDSKVNNVCKHILYVADKVTDFFKLEDKHKRVSLGRSFGKMATQMRY